MRENWSEGGGRRKRAVGWGLSYVVIALTDHGSAPVWRDEKVPGWDCRLASTAASSKSFSSVNSHFPRSLARSQTQSQSPSGAPNRWAAERTWVSAL
jgi:hypothetical protein